MARSDLEGLSGFSREYKKGKEQNANEKSLIDICIFYADKENTKR